MLDALPFAAFEAIVGQTVRMSRGDEYIDVEVVQAQKLNNPSPRDEPFMAILRENGVSRAAVQGMYDIHHPTLGILNLFVVPVGPDGKGMCYEVTFN